MNESAPAFDGQHGPTGFTGRTATSEAAANLYVRTHGQLGRGGSAWTAAPDGKATHTGGRQDMPVSHQFLQHQARQEADAITGQFMHHETDTPMFVGDMSAEQHPNAWLRQFGVKAVNGSGEDVTPSPLQARMIVGKLMQEMGRNESSGQPGHTSISVTDNALHPSLATVHARRLY